MKLQEVFAPPFAHEPDVVRGPKGEWVMTYSAYNAKTLALGLRGYNASSLAAAVCTNCTNGASPPQACQCIIIEESLWAMSGFLRCAVCSK